ncbi:MAG TPA: YMGG-like glycine zipper-containing protein, partial [Gallionellaceae bacterium]|nr:YMGG-like glycine zipper-containing protein [Gallionellaceae bacterium]
MVAIWDSANITSIITMIKETAMKYLTLLGLLLLSACTADGHLRNDALGGAIGGGAGAAIGSEIGGRNGAIIGGAIGGATGAAVGSDNETRRERHHRDDDEYDDDNEHHDNGRHLGQRK